MYAPDLRIRCRPSAIALACLAGKQAGKQAGNERAFAGVPTPELAPAPAARAQDAAFERNLEA
jgi:hypothetical protein